MPVERDPQQAARGPLHRLQFEDLDVVVLGSVDAVGRRVGPVQNAVAVQVVEIARVDVVVSAERAHFLAVGAEDQQHRIMDL